VVMPMVQDHTDCSPLLSSSDRIPIILHGGRTTPEPVPRRLVMCSPNPSPGTEWDGDRVMHTVLLMCDAGDPQG
jgi:hypothetical protein